ncbi:GATA transcription factor 26 -like protein [Gossypium arboreum]|uniref:GATA transcription factor 26-like protein n=2 Tax=Gossypium arboreum TaxID=29729 RepID=A0A0B0MHZ3_GOSAR|nr:GATA transcription factor 26 [Gossypium arboreum]KHG01753.1 GATA transcription factor 26 -like protein [Gossypium arboreum]
MGKQGPCYHCGVTSTPLWRNGPPEKPVLCNACGSRWRTKGTLANYTPLHARVEPADYEDRRTSRMKNISIKKNKEIKLLKSKANHGTAVVAPDYNLGFRKFVDEDSSNRSSSGSAISNSESCAQFGSADASDLTGPAQSNVWESMVPSKKRTFVNRPKQSPLEKLTKDLYTILHEQQSSYFSGSSEEDLLLESETPMVSVEIGHGSVLIRHPSSIARDEESEASSLSVENKQYSTNEAYSHSSTFPVYSDSKAMKSLGHAIEKAKNPAEEGMQHEQLKRDKAQIEKSLMLESQKSPLCNTDLNDILNFEEFVKHLTNEEQQQLLQYLPPVDIAKLPDSLQSMFESSQFKENLCYFQQLLAEGVFNISVPGVKAEDCRTLKRLALFNLTKSQWVERRHVLKRCQDSIGAPVVARGPTATTSNNLVIMKRSRDSQSQNFPEARTIKCPKRVVMKATCENKEVIDNDGSCFSPRSLFALPPDGSSLLLDSLHFVNESSDQDLLLDVPPNGSFPQAELLHPTLSFGQQASTSSSSARSHHVHP